VHRVVLDRSPVALQLGVQAPELPVPAGDPPVPAFSFGNPPGFRHPFLDVHDPVVERRGVGEIEQLAVRGTRCVDDTTVDTDSSGSP
jgi:hypothetical protein